MHVPIALYEQHCWAWIAGTNKYAKIIIRNNFNSFLQIISASQVYPVSSEPINISNNASRATTGRSPRLCFPRRQAARGENILPKKIFAFPRFTCSNNRHSDDAPPREIFCFADAYVRNIGAPDRAKPTPANKEKRQ